MDGISRTHPHVCAIGRLARRSNSVNSTLMLVTQITSASVVNIKNDLSYGISNPLMKHFKYSTAERSAFVPGKAQSMPNTFFVLGFNDR